MELPFVATAVSSNITTGLLIVGWPIDCWTVVSSVVHIFGRFSALNCALYKIPAEFSSRGGAPVATVGCPLVPPPVATRLF